jgi:FkbM family methyltransferase
MKALVKRLTKSIFGLTGYEFRRRPELYNSESFGLSPLEDMRQLLRIEGNLERPLVFDVGANVGTFVGHFRNAFNAPIIHAFEPSPETFKKLRANTTGMPGVTLNNVGLGARNMELQFLENDHAPMSSFLEPGTQCWGKIQQRVKVRVRTVDDYCSEKRIEKINILKSDTQGYDLEVIRGAERMMREQRIHLIYTEIVFAEMYKDQASIDEIYRHLHKFGFRLVAFYRFTYMNNRAGWTDALFAFVNDAPTKTPTCKFKS